MYKKILVPLDGSDLAECVFAHVQTITRGCSSIPEIVFVRAWKPFHEEGYPSMGMMGGSEAGISNQQVSKHYDTAVKAAAEKYLQEVVSKNKIDNVKVRTEVLMGNPADVIAEYANKNEFDLIVIATHGRSGASRWVWGSTADRILRSVCVPVMMVRSPGCVPGI